MTIDRSKWQACSKTTISFLLTLLLIGGVGSLFAPPLHADEFSVTTAEKRPDFEGMKLKASAEFNQELDKCHKLKPEECEKCKEEAGQRFQLVIKKINDEWRK